MATENGEYVTENRSFDACVADNRNLAAWAHEKKAQVVVMESTGVYWMGLRHELAAFGLNVAVVNPHHVKNMVGKKTDTEDCQWLAQIGLMGTYSPSFIPTPYMEDLRMISRDRMSCVRDLTGFKNRFHKTLSSLGVRLSAYVSDLHGKSARLMIEDLINGASPEEAIKNSSPRLKSCKEDLLKSLEGKFTPVACSVLRDQLERIKAHEARIEWQEAFLKSEAAEFRPEINLLMTIPGVNEVSAISILAEIGTDMSRFKNAGHLSSWAGMCPGNNESAGKRRSGRTTRGNISLRRTLTEVANAAIKTNSMLRDKYRSLVVRRGHKRSIVAIGHKILRIIYSMLKKKEVYKDNTVD
jgi:transposase